MSADPLSYTTTVIPGRPAGMLSQRLLTCKNPPHKHWTDRQVSNSSLIYPLKDNRRRGVTITFLHGCSNEADHSAVGVGKISPTHSIVTYRCEWNIGLPMGYRD